MRPLTALALLLVLDFPSSSNHPSAIADESTPIASSRQVDRSRVESLIAGLRLPNKDPNRTGEPFVRYPKDYDHEAQTRIRAARDVLLAMGKHAISILIEHMDDPGYSMSEETAILASRTVGDVCRGIIDRQIDPVAMRYKMRD